jgi:hypothetical protein
MAKEIKPHKHFMEKVREGLWLCRCVMTDKQILLLDKTNENTSKN